MSYQEIKDTTKNKWHQVNSELSVNRMDPDFKHNPEIPDVISSSENDHEKEENNLPRICTSLPLATETETRMENSILTQTGSDQSTKNVQFDSKLQYKLSSQTILNLVDTLRLKGGRSSRRSSEEPCAACAAAKALRENKIKEAKDKKERRASEASYSSKCNLHEPPAKKMKRDSSRSQSKSDLEAGSSGQAGKRKKSKGSISNISSKELGRGRRISKSSGSNLELVGKGKKGKKGKTGSKSSLSRTSLNLPDQIERTKKRKRSLSKTELSSTANSSKASLGRRRSKGRVSKTAVSRTPSKGSLGRTKSQGSKGSKTALTKRKGSKSSKTELTKRKGSKSSRTELTKRGSKASIRSRSRSSLSESELVGKGSKSGKRKKGSKELVSGDRKQSFGFFRRSKSKNIQGATQETLSRSSIVRFDEAGPSGVNTGKNKGKADEETFFKRFGINATDAYKLTMFILFFNIFSALR